MVLKLQQKKNTQIQHTTFIYLSIYQNKIIQRKRQIHDLPYIFEHPSSYIIKFQTN